MAKKYKYTYICKSSLSSLYPTIISNKNSTQGSTTDLDYETLCPVTGQALTCYILVQQEHALAMLLVKARHEDRLATVQCVVISEATNDKARGSCS